MFWEHLPTHVGKCPTFLSRFWERDKKSANVGKFSQILTNVGTFANTCQQMFPLFSADFGNICRPLLDIIWIEYDLNLSEIALQHYSLVQIEDHFIFLDLQVNRGLYPGSAVFKFSLQAFDTVSF